MREAIEGVLAGITACLISYILIVVFSTPFLPDILPMGSRVSGLDTWLLYETAGRPILAAAAWVLTGAHGMQIQFSMPGASTEAYLVLQSAPWVLFVGPLACVISGLGFTKFKQQETGLALSAAFFTSGYTLLMVTLASYAGITENMRTIKPILKPVVFPPWFIVLPLVAAVFGTIGILLGERVFIRARQNGKTLSRDYPRFYEAIGGIGATVLAYLITGVLAYPRLAEMLRGMGKQEWDIYVAVGRPTWKAIAWALLNSYSVPLSFSSDVMMGGGDRLALELAPWVYLAGPIASFIIGYIFSQGRLERGILAISCYSTLGQTLSLVFISFVMGATAEPYLVNIDLFEANNPIPPVLVIILVSLSATSLGVLAERFRQNDIL